MHEKRVITYGTFDLFHVGHVRLLERLAGLGDHLTVCVSTDKFNLRKGKKSVISYEDRAEIVQACQYVDQVLPDEDWEQKRADITREEISIFGMGDDWTGKFNELTDICEVVYLPRTEHVSSTTLKSFLKSLGRKELRDTKSLVEALDAPASKGEETILAEVKEAILAGEVSIKDYHRILAKVEKCRDLKDFDWLQAWILLHCATRKKAFPTQKIISKFSRMSRRKGQTEAYQSFLTYVVDDLKLYLPNGSSYTETFRTADMIAVLKGCSDAVDLLSKEGLEVFANSGTLLGLVREGAFLEHDNDIDLGVILEAQTEKDAAEEWITLCEKLIAQGLAQSRSEWSKVTLKLDAVLGFGVDLFPAWISADDSVYVYPHTYGNLTKSQLFPFKTHGDTGLKMPADSKAMLASNYGDDWRVPNEGWTFGWPAANEKFADFISFLRAG
jgi:glycerol-3-phosphate cytidylyltransferase